MDNKFLARLDQGPLLCDGATGTMLYNRGAPANRPLDELNLTNPAIVAEVHRAYIDAGSEVIETNTFGANRIKLAKYGLESKVTEINQAAVKLARRVIEASFKEIFIAGSVGPLGAHLAPLGRLQLNEAFAAFKEQIEALVAANVDLLIFETFGDLKELEQALHAARAVDGAIPIVAQVTFTNDGVTPMGDAPADVAEMMNKLNVDVVGANCSVGPARVLRSIKIMADHLQPGTYLSAQPNAGWPHRLGGGRLVYPATPDYFGDYAATFAHAGVSLIGGCCGTTEVHIAKMRYTLDHLSSQPVVEVVSSATLEKTDAPVDVLNPTQLAQKLAAGEFVTSVEIHPPHGASAAKVLAAAGSLQEAGVTVVNVADSPVARMKMSPWAVCHLIQSEVGLETVLNFPTRGRNLLRIQGDLLAAHALNIRNLFVVMGDPTAIGDYPEAFNHHDVVSSGLIKLVKRGFNTGIDYAGKPISQPTNFLVGGALNLNAIKLEKEVNLLKKKIDNGVDFVMTQPIYTPEPLEQFVAAYEDKFGPLSIPILVSILPLYNERHARFLHNEVPGITIPQQMQYQMSQAGEHASQQGLSMAYALITEIRERIAGVYIMPPFKRYNLAAELLEMINASSQ